jgi:SAM-dependent methyltransferase
VGYRQFCQHFLAPLYLAAGRDPRLSVLSSSWIDGIPLEMARALAPRRYRWRPGFFTHISLHAGAQRRFQDSADRPPRPAPRLSRAALRNLLDSLRGAIEHLSWNPDRTVWADYYANTNYTDAAMERKRRFVGAVARATAPARVVDLGANTGAFSAIAAEAGAYVVAADVDHGAVETCFRRETARAGHSVLPLVVDLASPPPAAGWMNRERPSFLERCAGRTDLVLALALVHHLAIGNNVPLGSFFELLARVGREAVVEFVGKDDSQVRRLLASREDIFPDYSEAGFERALAPRYRVARREPIEGTHRVLYHLVRG